MSTETAQTPAAVCVGDHVAITDGNIDFGRWAGCPATIVGVSSDGWWVVPDSGVPGRREVRIDGKWVPMRIWVESIRPDAEAP